MMVISLEVLDRFVVVVVVGLVGLLVVLRLLVLGLLAILLSYVADDAGVVAVGLGSSGFVV